jgi:hypothetical protein
VEEAGPGSTTRVFNLLSEVQEYGNPPKEILSSLMPGLEFDAENNPILPELDSSPNNMLAMLKDDQRCCVM